MPRRQLTRKLIGKLPRRPAKMPARTPASASAKSSAQSSAAKIQSKHRLSRPTYTNHFTRDQLINAESALGRTIFGAIPEGHQREFFTSRKNVWIWHESWTDQSGALQEMTVRYEVRPTGIYKRANRGKYEQIVGDELNNFRLAAHSYLDLVKTKLYC